MKHYELADMPPTIPLFAISGALLLPQTSLPLHVFEPRYIALIDDVLKTKNRIFGIIQPKESPNDGLDNYSVGCAGRITSFDELGDGRYNIALSGICRFRVLDYLPDEKPYRCAAPDWLEFSGDLNEPDSCKDFDRQAFCVLINRYFASEKKSENLPNLENLSDKILINAMSIICPLPSSEKQLLLETPNLRQRAELLMKLILFSFYEKGSKGIVQ